MASSISNVVDLLKVKIKATKDENEKAQAMIEDLKGKLANESDQREKAEVMFNDSNNKVQLLEQELEKVNERLTLISAKYEEASKAADESGRLHRSVLWILSVTKGVLASKFPI